MQITFLDSFEKIPKVDWQKLNTASCPLVSYSFFKALESSKSVTIERGWQPHHMIIEKEGDIKGILPLYLKQHSWGEYVFDWSWAEAFDDHQLTYYPKLVATIPFTPLPSDKLLTQHLKLDDLFNLLSDHCQQSEISSWHILFVAEEKDQLAGVVLPDDVYQRHTVQFHWFNQNYTSFDNFIETFTSRKRKNTRKERASITQQGISIRRLQGKEITADDIDFFYLTYQLTYIKNGHQPHITFAFFKEIFTCLADNLLLIIASHAGENVACSLFFHDDTHLYGRYWGCKGNFNNLHFELCYYQGIEYCIENNLQCFNPGTQGEHKIQRGFEPVLTHSYHWIKHTAFKPAIKDFCDRERDHMRVYFEQCRQLLPFKCET